MTTSRPRAELRDRSGVRLCVFESARHRFALPLEAIAEVVPMMTLGRPPRLPSVLEGILNLRGTAVSVVRLAVLLGLPSDPLERHTPLLIVRQDDLRFALLVAKVIDIRPMPPGGVTPLAATTSFNGCVAGQVRGDDDPDAVPVLSLPKLLLAQERQVVAEFGRIETERLHRAAVVQ
jgi:purine-binding chemotaxis protein CheW